MWQTIIDLAKEYGLFPAGIIVGIWLTKWATSKMLDLMESEKKGLREEKRELHEFIKSQQNRIDKLYKE